MRPWWQRYPGRWQAERDALTAVGARYRVDTRAKAAGRLRIRLTWPAPPGTTTDGPLRLLAVYPDTYPFFPPDVTDTGGLPLVRHRHPRTGRLCLVHPEDWDVDTTLAALLTQQLPRLLSPLTTGQDPTDDEDRDPVTLYGPVAPCSMIVVDGGWRIPTDVTDGLLFAKLRAHGPDIHVGAVTHVLTGDTVLGKLPDTVATAFDRPVIGRWVRLPHYDPNTQPAQLWEDAQSMLGHQPEPDLSALPAPRRRRWEWVRQRWQLRGLLIEDDLRPGQRGTCWLFLLRHRPSPRHAWRVDLVQSGQIGATELAERRPQTTALADRSAVLAGAGALGGVIATELANAGLGHLHLIDGDIVDPATFCRQLGTLQLAGLPKTNAIAAELALHSPHTTVVPDPLRIGNALNPSGEHEHWSALAQDADLVIDATANPAASRYLAALAAATGTAFLHASATAGGHGGLVARLRPRRTEGCWACLVHHRADHTIPTPPAAADGPVHPARCTQPTFTGTGTDLRSIALHAARLTIATLIDGQPGAYSDFTDDVHVASLFDTEGHAIPVRWYSTGLPRHRACPLHADTGPNPAAPVDLPATGANDTGCTTSAQPARGLDDAQRGAAGAAGHSTTAQAARREATDRTEDADAAVADHNADRTFPDRREKGAPGRPPSTSDPDPENCTEETNRRRRVDAGARDETGTTGGDSQRRRPEHRHHKSKPQAVQP